MNEEWSRIAANAVCFEAERLRQTLLEEYCRPSTKYRPTLSKDGNAWIALYGENLAVGVVGTGSSPEEAMYDFDAAWFKKVPA